MKRPTILTTAVLLALSALPALAQSGAGTPPMNPNNTGLLPDALKVTPPAQPGTLTVSKSQVKSGRPVRMTFTVVNTSGHPVTYNFSTGQRFDVTAANAAGTAVWDWAAPKRFSQNLASLSLPPGKSLIYRAVWNGRDSSGRPVPPGAYTLSAHLTSDNRPAITGGVIVNTDPDPTNMGTATRTPAEAGTIRQVAPAAQVSAKTTVVIK